MFIIFVRWRLSVGIKRFTYLLTYLSLCLTLTQYLILFIYLSSNSTRLMWPVLTWPMPRRCLTLSTRAVWRRWIFGSFCGLQSSDDMMQSQSWTWIGSIHGLDWIGLDWIGLGQQNWTHVQLCAVQWLENVGRWTPIDETKKCDARPTVTYPSSSLRFRDWRYGVYVSCEFLVNFDWWWCCPQRRVGKLPATRCSLETMG